jgi:uncharacterized protein
VDEEGCRVTLAGTKSSPLPGGSTSAQPGRSRRRCSRTYPAGGPQHRRGDHAAALEGLLEKRLPRLEPAPGTPIVSDPSAPLAQTIDAVRRLDGSYMFIQGPPGAGKTYTGSHVIAALLADGKRVAVSSNSHKAINNLLAAVDKLMVERRLSVPAAKKSTAGDPDTRPAARASPTC